MLTVESTWVTVSIYLGINLLIGVSLLGWAIAKREINRVFFDGEETWADDLLEMTEGYGILHYLFLMTTLGIVIFIYSFIVYINKK